MRRKSKAVDHGACGREVLIRLTDEECLELWKRVLLFVKNKYYNVDGEDLITEAFQAVLEGRRGWDPSQPPFDNLRSIVRSIASNQLAKEKRFSPLNDDPENPPTPDTTSTPPLPPSQAAKYELDEEDQRFIDHLSRKLKGNRLSRRIVAYLMETPHWKPDIIAGALRVEKKDVNNARKRLIRALKP